MLGIGKRVSKSTLLRWKYENYDYQTEKIKQAIIKWDEKYISSLLEEDVESLAKFIAKELR